MNDTRPQQARGLTQVQTIVQVFMKCGWQEISAINDNGVDGIIIDRKKGIDTGNIYYAQVKCGDGYLVITQNRPNVIGINLGQKYIEDHRERWAKLQGPTILIYVDFQTGKCWWANLKSEESYIPENKSIVVIPKKNRFGIHSIGNLRRLRNHIDLDRHLDIIQIPKSELVIETFNEPIKQMAKLFYNNWANSAIIDKTNPKVGQVIISRVGWRHITRRGRGLDNIYQSWLLLGAAKEIIKLNDKPYQIKKPDISCDMTKQVIHDYLTLRSRVVFPNRQESVVQVVLKRKQTIEFSTGNIVSKIWFYSVHEPRKGKKNAIR